MQFQYISYIWPLIISAFIVLSLGIYALLRRRNAKGAMSFILSMIILTIWTLANALEMSGGNLSTKLFWANVQYFAYCYSPVTLLALCTEFTDYDRWIRNKKILWLAVIPTIIIILAWTDGLHGLIRYDIHMNYSGTFPVIEKKYGPIFFIHAVYSHALNLFSWILLLKTVFLKNATYRKQATALLIALSFIILPNILYILDFGMAKGFDLTPAFFGPAGLIAAWGIFRLSLFDIVPIAWATVIHTMDVGVMVLDLKGRILDINPTFEKIVGCTASMASSKQAEEVCGKITELASACADRNTSYKEFSITINELSKVYEVQLSQLVDERGKLIGRLAVTYEITEKKKAQQAIIKHQWELVAIEERERLSRDLHDNLGQVLGFINLQAQGIRQELASAGVVMALTKLDKLVDVTQSAHNEIREYIRSVRNSAFAAKDFISVLKKEIMCFEEQSGVAVQLDTPYTFSAEELAPNVQFNLLNIIKEALNNIQKHAYAKHVKVSICTMEERLIITIEDDGNGFNIKKQNKEGKNTYGLIIMQERALDIEGKIDIQSLIGQGTRVIVSIQMKKEGTDIYEVNIGR